MGGRSTFALLVVVWLSSVAGASYAELTVTGTKDFQYRSFSITGSLNQFLMDYPTFLTDRGFNQSLRLNVTGTIGDNVKVDCNLDDTYDVEKDRKLLIRVDGKDFSVSAGRLTLELPQTRYLLFNKKALAASVRYRKGRHELTFIAGRPEGDSMRDFFQGRGTQQEYTVRSRPVIQGSEIVQLDGRLLVRGSEYDFDYEEGTLVINRKLLPIEPTSTITIEYEAMADGSEFKSTVLGVRECYTFPPRAPRAPAPKPARRAPRPAPSLAKASPAAVASNGACTLTTASGSSSRLTTAASVDVTRPAGKVPNPHAPGARPGSRGQTDDAWLVPNPRSRRGRAAVAGPDRIGVSAVMSTEQDSTGSTTTTTRVPERLSLVGADLSYEVVPGWRIVGEGAGSFRNTNLRLADAPVVKGAVYDMAIEHHGPRADLRIAQQYLGPGFSAIGKNEFVRLGEVADLSSNLRLTSASSRYNLTDRLFLDSTAERSQTNLDRTPTLNERLFTGLGNVITWAPTPDSKVVVRHRDETDDFGLPGATKSHGTHRVRSGAITRPFGRLVAQVRTEITEDRGVRTALATTQSTALLLGESVTAAAGDTRTVAFSLGDSTRKRLKWSVNAQNLTFDDLVGTAKRDALTLSAFTDVVVNRATSGSLTLTTRRERDLILDEDVRVNTGEARGRYQPSDRLVVNVKGSAEQRSRILRVSADPRLDLIPKAYPDVKTVATDRPVTTFNTSNTVDWRPTKRWDHRLSARLRKETDVITKEDLSTNEAAGYRLRFAPGTVFRTTSEVEKGLVTSKMANLDRDTWLLNQELMWSFKSGLNLSLAYQDTDSKERVGTLRERTTVESVNAERTFGRFFTGLCKVAHTHKIQGGESGENSLGAGVRYSPPKLNLRVQLDVEAGSADGVDVRGTRFSSSNRKTGLKIDGQPVKNLNVEAHLNFVKAGPNARGDPGYEGYTIESKAFLDF